MIRVVIYRQNQQTYAGYQISGHAGYDQAGKDIVCSAVSALGITIANSLESLTDNICDVKSTEDGYLQVLIKETDDYGQLLIQTFILGIKSIEQVYGSKYIKITFKEV